MRNVDGNNFDNSESSIDQPVNSFKIKIVYAHTKDEILIDVNTEFPIDALASDITSHLKSGVFGYVQNEKMILIPTNQILKLEIVPSQYTEEVNETEITDCKIKICNFLEKENKPKRLTKKLGYRDEVIKLAAQQLVEEDKIKLVSWGKYKLI